jgi:hypothetical protein
LVPPILIVLSFYSLRLTLRFFFSRARKRDANRKKAQEHLLRGEVSQANDCFQKAVDITPLMANNLIQVTSERGDNYDDDDVCELHVYFRFCL